MSDVLGPRPRLSEDSSTARKLHSRMERRARETPAKRTEVADLGSFREGETRGRKDPSRSSPTPAAAGIKFFKRMRSPSQPSSPHRPLPPRHAELSSEKSGPRPRCHDPRIRAGETRKKDISLLNGSFDPLVLGACVCVCVFVCAPQLRNCM